VRFTTWIDFCDPASQALATGPLPLATTPYSSTSVSYSSGSTVLSSSGRYNGKSDLRCLLANVALRCLSPTPCKCGLLLTKRVLHRMLQFDPHRTRAVPLSRPCHLRRLRHSPRPWLRQSPRPPT